MHDAERHLGLNEGEGRQAKGRNDKAPGHAGARPAPPSLPPQQMDARNDHQQRAGGLQYGVVGVESHQRGLRQDGKRHFGADGKTFQRIGIAARRAQEADAAHLERPIRDKRDNGVALRSGPAEDKGRVMQQYKYPRQEPGIGMRPRATCKGAERADKNKQGAQIGKQR